MNKRKIDEYIPRAYEIINNKIAYKDEKNEGRMTVDSEFRGYISSFGAAVTMGSLKAAVAYFSNQAGSAKNRALLMSAIYELIKKDSKEENLLKWVCSNEETLTEAQKKEEILNAAIALKLAMNMFFIKKGKNDGKS